MWGEKSTMQRVYEFVVRSGRDVQTREIVAAIGAQSVSSVTFALTRLVREGNLERTGYARYRARSTPARSERDPLEPLLEDERLKRIFEAVRPNLRFDDLAFLYHIVLTTMRLAPDLFRTEAPSSPPQLESEPSP